MDYESMLFDVAPWAQEVMRTAKTLNSGWFLRGRTGWAIRGIETPEQDYVHDCKVGLAGWYVFRTRKAVELGIGHEFPEILEPDRLPGEIDAKTKHLLEDAAMVKLSQMLPNGKHWLSIWREYESQTGISIVIKELDKIDPCIQAVDYLAAGYTNHRLEEFYPHARKSIKTHQLVELLDTICLHGPYQGKSAYQAYFKGLEMIHL